VPAQNTLKGDYMRLKRIESRIKRLEGRTKEGECAGCNETAAMQITAAMENEDGSSIDVTPCPVCGNPYPQVSIRYAREMLKLHESDEE
jgi:hypothetical protein